MPSHAELFALAPARARGGRRVGVSSKRGPRASMREKAACAGNDRSVRPDSNVAKLRRDNQEHDPL